MRKTTHFALPLALALSVSACGGGYDRDQPAPQPNQAPTLSAIGDRTLNQDTTDSAVTFTVADADSGIAGLTLSVSSSDTVLLPVTGIVLGGANDMRTLAITPAEGAAGTATVTVSVRDAQGLSANRSFLVTVYRVFVSFTGFANETFAQAESESARLLRGFTLDADADDNDAAFAALLP